MNFLFKIFIFCFFFVKFTDLCILLGCDYCDSIKGIGQKRALDLIKQYRNIETILENIDKKVRFHFVLYLNFNKNSFSLIKIEI